MGENPLNTYFITGGTGVVGSAIVDRLLRTSNDRIVLLLRARSTDELTERRDELLRYCDVEPEQGAARVSAVAGDTTQPGMAMSPADYAACIADVTHIIHCAGAVRMNLPIEAARASAVGACKQVITFARGIGDARSFMPKTEFVSTVGVGGRLQGTVPERWIREPRDFHNTYEQSKAEAEALIEKSVAEGMRVTVHRPSMVVGDSRTGKVIHFQVFYHLLRFLTGSRTFGFLPDPGDTVLDLVSSDFVAEAIVQSSAREESIGQVLHLAAGPTGGIPITALRARIEQLYGQAGTPVGGGRIVPVWVFRTLIPLARAVSDDRTKRALATLPVFLDYLDSNQRFANETTTRLLRSWGMTIPRSEDLLPPVVRYYLAKIGESPSTSA